MQDYSITIAPDEASHEFAVVLRGPGIEAGGRRYVFANPDRCATFAQAVNFAYRQGFRDGRVAAREDSRGELLIVSGATPESLVVHPESWWRGTRRRWRHRNL